ncbi:YoaK family protein [Humibacter sp. RRB41]|uniref:YoaK family protein n=1 Tax=Humibacter sp. RRB41 TaxID=2919946 RepID=UPI001FAAA4FD|nr:YoaK family protein [Humibacter sp. RRB41]
MAPTRTSHALNYFAHPAHGPLPAILLVLTFGTGLVDATSIIGLGRVFVANMTGNIVFIGFALARVPGYSLWGSLVALAGFLVGASIGGVAITRFSTHRGKLLRNALVVQLALFAAVLAISISGEAPLHLGHQLLILTLGAIALGIQNAVVRHLAVPDMTTTVLTMTLTGIASDLRKRDLTTATRRLIAVLAMLIGAVIGAILVVNLGVSAGIAAVTIVLAAALVGATFAARGTPSWTASAAAA